MKHVYRNNSVLKTSSPLILLGLTHDDWSDHDIFVKCAPSLLRLAHDPSDSRDVYCKLICRTNMLARLNSMKCCYT